ncbi:MAG: type II secretion system major pseudopilin GspG [Pelagibacterales bacterium]|jgi:general secretion pathway protein G|nr:type II secretion system major pseudopilin GspG [Pelagibacterales bacterium]|tara:strand:+ start:307 stop:717 length:411 start_codon:yes stop_codon:yes gene_type:complete
MIIDYKKQDGFTLIEIMVVLIIIAIMASFVVPSVINRPDQARFTKVKNDILTIESALDLYKLDNGTYPSNDKGLEALIEDEDNLYLKRLPLDPWNEPYQYSNPGKNSKIDIFSLGADSQLGGNGNDKDIGNWNLEN